MNKTERITISEGFDIVHEKAPIYHVDATPNRDYPLRILRAYLDTSRVECTVKELETAMNKAIEERNIWLNKAIRILEKEL